MEALEQKIKHLENIIDNTKNSSGVKDVNKSAIQKKPIKPQQKSYDRQKADEDIL